MDFVFSKEQKRVYDIAGALGKECFAPRARRHDVDASTPLDNLRDLFDAGLTGLTIRKSFGGGGSGVLGEDPFLSLLVVEQTARFCPSTAQCIHIHFNACHTVDQIGTDDLRERLLRPVLERGDLLNLTGSEPGRTARGLYALQTVAVPVEGGFRVTGVKNYATLAADVGHNILYALVEGRELPDAHIALAIPKGAAGLKVRPGSWNPLGMRGAVSPEIELTDCFVAAENQLGKPGEFQRDRWQAKTHLSFAQQYVGGCEGIFDFLVDYLPKRGTVKETFAQLRLGEIRIAIDAARWLVYRAISLWQQGDQARAELAAMGAKHHAIATAVQVMDQAAQIAGSSAFAEDSPLSRYFRDLRVQTLHNNIDQAAATVGKFHLGQPYDVTARL
ncbi:MAG: acyl-CoA dehydrogenase family protein [Janthinobacterium lividum]